MFGLRNVYGLGYFDGYGTGLAQARIAVEQQKVFMIGSSGLRPTDLLSALLMANYRPPNPIPWEKRYADFCARLDRATSNRPPSVSV